MATLLKCDGFSQTVEPEDGSTFSLKELYKLLDCSTIEIIYLRNIDGSYNDEILICDEESKLKEQICLNLRATELWWQGQFPIEIYETHAGMLQVFGVNYVIKAKLDFIVGNCIHCNKSNLR